MNSILFLALKDLRLLARDKFGLFWVIAFPLLMALFFGAIFSSGESGASRLSIAVVNESSSSVAKQFVEQLQQSSALSIRYMSHDSARTLVGMGKLAAFVELSDSAKQASSFFLKDMPVIKVGIDPKRKAESGYLQGILTQAYFVLMQQQIMNPAKIQQAVDDLILQIDSSSTINPETKAVMKRFFSSLKQFTEYLSINGADSSSSFLEASPFASPPIEMEEISVDVDKPRSSFEITFPQGLLWGLLGVTMAFAMSIVQERTKGTYLRLRIAPITRAQILAGKGLASFLACVLISVILMTIAKLVFGVRVVNPAGLALAVVCTAVCFSGIVMLVSVMGRTEQAVAGAGWAIMLVQSMVGGGMVPLMFMPSWMKVLSNFSAVKWGIYAFEGAIWRGFSLHDMIFPLVVLTMIGVVTFTIGVTILMRYEQ